MQRSKVCKRLRRYPTHVAHFARGGDFKEWAGAPKPRRDSCTASAFRKVRWPAYLPLIVNLGPRFV